MENYHYEEVKTTTDITHDYGKRTGVNWKPFFIQLMICSGIWTCYFILGVSIGSTTVLVPQLRREANSTEAVTPEMASWMASMHGFGGVPWALVLPLMSYYLGRRIPYRLICAVALSGSLLFYFSTSVSQILISEALTCIIATGQFVMFLVVLPEFTSPQYRGVFLTIKSATFMWGVWVSNAIGTFFHWKNIGILQIVCCCYISLTSLFWPESPYWLASKGRYDECKIAHQWLKGTNEFARKELQSILDSKKNKGNISVQKYRFYKTVTSKRIWKPIYFILLLLILYYTTGKTVVTVYAIDIIKEISKNESLAYMIMLILDGITVFSMYVGCAVSKILKRKVFLFYTTSFGIVFLSIISIYLYLIRFSVIVENKFFTVCLLTCYSIAVSCGPLLLSTSICGELLPLQFRNTTVCIIAILERVLFGIVLKVSPYVFHKLGAHGSFLFYAVSTFLVLLYLNKYLPETKDRTLHEIEIALLRANI